MYIFEFCPSLKPVQAVGKMRWYICYGKFVKSVFFREITHEFVKWLYYLFHTGRVRVRVSITFISVILRIHY